MNKMAKNHRQVGINGKMKNVSPHHSNLNLCKAYFKANKTHLLTTVVGSMVTLGPQI